MHAQISCSRPLKLLSSREGAEPVLGAAGGGKNNLYNDFTVELTSGFTAIRHHSGNPSLAPEEHSVPADSLKEGEKTDSRAAAIKTNRQRAHNSDKMLSQGKLLLPLALVNLLAKVVPALPASPLSVYL